jgi:hypothetical protein
VKRCTRVVHMRSGQIEETAPPAAAVARLR